MIQRILSVLGALTASALCVEPVSACGGLFCSNASPVNQAAERIIFAQSGDRTSAVIEIQYEGPSGQFAWVLPVPAGEVTVGVSSKQALDALQQQSNPQFVLQTRSECSDTNFLSSARASADESATSAEGSDGSVTVLESGTVGPYDYVQLGLDDSLDDPADVAVNWLEEAGFDVSNIGRELLGPYLEQGMDLLAFRLTKGTDTGSIRPVMLEYTAENPVIPIRPTAVAANADMGVMVWVLGDARAVPVNYLHLELNEAKIDWFNPAATYDDVVIAAADEAGGQGFVTEQSGDAEPFAEALYPEFKASEFGRLRQDTFGSQAEFFRTALNFATTFDPVTFTNTFYDGFLDVMNDPAVVPLREGATVEQFLQCPECYYETDVAVANDAYPSTPYVAETDPMTAFDVASFLGRLEDAVVTPLSETRALFEAHSTVTRFYTTLSPDEMTVDPVFDFNPDLVQVSNVHTATQVLGCGSNWRIELPQGGVLRGEDQNWPVAVGDDMALNFRILQLGTSGEGEVLVDNSEAILEATRDTADEGGFCGVARGHRSPSWAWALFSLALFGLARHVVRGESKSR